MHIYIRYICTYIYIIHCTLYVHVYTHKNTCTHVYSGQFSALYMYVLYNTCIVYSVTKVGRQCDTLLIFPLYTQSTDILYLHVSMLW